MKHWPSWNIWQTMYNLSIMKATSAGMGLIPLVSRNYQYIEEKSFKSNLYQYMVSAVLNLNKMPKLHQQ